MIDVTPCQLGPIAPRGQLGGRPRVRAACACGITISSWDDAQVRDLYAQHLAIPRPPAEVLAKAALTKADVRAWPDFFISGPGRAVASRTLCPHEYYLTDSCPGCDADQEAGQPMSCIAYTTGAGTARVGDHFHEIDGPSWRVDAIQLIERGRSANAVCVDVRSAEARVIPVGRLLGSDYYRQEAGE